MPTNLLALAAASTIGLLAAPALAQPGAGAGFAPVAPQHVDWSAVSNINGQLVKVGEQVDYFYAQKQTVISVNPVGLIFGDYALDISHAVTPNLAIRADASYIALPDANSTISEIGFGVPIYLRRTFSGPFVEPGAIYRTSTSSWDNGDSNTTVTAGPQVLVGYAVTYDSGLSMAMAVGAGRDVIKQDSTDEYSSNDPIFANGYLRVGYAF